MIKYFVTWCIILCIKPAIGQAPSPTLYKDFVFEKSVVKKKSYYSNNISPQAKKKAYRFDLYQPDGDSNKLRPLIIWLHGGGFKFGSNRSRGIPTWSKTFAKRGYTCAAINYRKSKKKPLSRFADLAEGCYDAISDLQQAVSYFKANAAAYNIDTNKIILAGNSAGAIIALQAVYSNPSQLAKLSGQANFDTLSDDNNLKNIACVINFWGAVFDTSWLRNASIPIVSVHGTSDNLVPYTHTDSPLYGSLLIHKEADALGIPNKLKPYPGYRHELQKRFNPVFVSGATHRRWVEAGEFAADFLSALMTNCFNKNL
jgi:acetyl esterase/lipase